MYIVDKFFFLGGLIIVVFDIFLIYSLDDCIEYIEEDELVEVMFFSIRMCKNFKMVKKGR